MKQDNQVLLIVLVVFFVIFFCICGFVDAKSFNNEPITIIYLSLVNVIVTGFLTYLLLETTIKSNRVNDKLVELSKMEIIERRIKNHLDELAIVEKYIKIVDDIYLMTLRHISIDKKYNMLKDLFSKDITVNQYMFLNKDDEFKLPNEKIFKEIKKINNIKNIEYQSEIQIINNLFNNSIHFKIYKKDLNNFNSSYNELKHLFEESFLNYYPFHKKTILNRKPYIEQLGEKITLDNYKQNSNIERLKVDTNIANELSMHLRGLVNELKELRSELEINIEEIKNNQ